MSLCVIGMLVFTVARAETPDFSEVTRALCQQLSHPEAPLVYSPECGGLKRLFGGSLAIAYKGKIIYEVATGAATIDGADVVRRGSLFRVASLHKPITAVAIMRLVQDGQLDLNSPVFGNRSLHGIDGIIKDAGLVGDIKPGSEVLKIRVDHLLRHASGWPEASSYAPFALRKTKDKDHPHGIAGRFEKQNRADLDTLVKYMANLQPVKLPGKEYHYNNMNYVVLNKVIEAVSGLSYAEYFRRNIFGPLGIQAIKPAKTFFGDRYSNEVQYIWPSLTEPSNQHEQYCTGDLVPSQYGLFRLEGNWVATPRGLISLFDAIDKGVPERAILNDRTIDRMFAVKRISGTNVVRGWSNVDRHQANAGNWSFTGGNAGTAARFMKTHDGFKIAYLRNSSPNLVEQKQFEGNRNNPIVQKSFETQWSPRWMTKVALREVRKLGKLELESAGAVPPAPTTDEWKTSSLSVADIQAGCQAEAINPCANSDCDSNLDPNQLKPQPQVYDWPHVLLCRPR